MALDFLARKSQVPTSSQLVENHASLTSKVTLGGLLREGSDAFFKFLFQYNFAIKKAKYIEKNYCPVLTSGLHRPLTMAS